MENSIEAPPPFWVALSMGNTHWRWGYFAGQTLIQHWTMKPPPLERLSLNPDWLKYCEISPAFAWHQHRDRPSFPPLYLASVVQAGQQSWLEYPNLYPLTLKDIPLKGLYDTLGIDRALAVLGAGHHYGWPILVIDAGTALTFSGAHARQFEGGAIAPGIGLQLRMLTQETAALPEVEIPAKLPPRWATNTPEAILSGILYSTLDSIITFHQHWTDQYPNSQVVLTGGDGLSLLTLLKEKSKQEHTGSTQVKQHLENISYDEHLIFRGMGQCITQKQDARSGD